MQLLNWKEGSEVGKKLGMTNTISRRVYDFIKDHPPFSLLETNRLLDISERVVVQYRQPEEVVFRTGEHPGKFIYMVREGAVNLYRQVETGEELLVEQCEEGDVFGMRPLLADDQYALTAKVAEESLLYAIDISGFKDWLYQHPKVAFYLASNMAAGLRRRTEPGLGGRLQATPRPGHGAHNFQLLELQSIERSKPPVICSPHTPIRDAARIMTTQEVGSIIIASEQGWPLGIITDKDLRKKVATGEVGLHEPASAIMSSPVVTVGSQVTVADVQIEMVRRRIHHLCVTEDGTDQSGILGVISEHDLLVLQGNNPAVLIREIRRATAPAGLRQLRERAEDLLRQYLEQEVAIAYIASIMTEVNDEIIRRCIALALAEKDEAPPASFCWLALGSEGRGEQLLRTDQDNALVFADVPPEALPVAKAWFLSMAKSVNEKLNDVGFEFCPADMMAGNEKWCLSLSQWKEQFSHWMLSPTPEAVLHSTIFFDYRPAYGDERLAQELTQHIFSILDRESLFLSFLAKDALQNPAPLTFFRNFMVESSGEHKDEFDIKARAMMPLTDAARVLVLHNRAGGVNNTFKRFEKLAELEPNHRELFQEAADAYEILIRLRALQGLRHANSGRFFNPAELSKMERIHLRNAFRPVKELQSLLSVRFQLVYFS